MDYYLAIAYQKITEMGAAVDREMRKFFQIVNDGYTTPIYVFLQGIPIPFRLSQISLEAAGTPPIHWYYDKSRHLFYKNGHAATHSHRLPWLTAEVKQGTRTLYDCSDFVNEVRWAAAEGTTHPTFEEILAAWTLESGIVLGHHPDFVMECINEEGDMIQHRL